MLKGPYHQETVMDILSHLQTDVLSVVCSFLHFRDLVRMQHVSPLYGRVFSHHKCLRSLCALDLSSEEGVKRLVSCIRRSSLQSIDISFATGELLKLLQEGVFPNMRHFGLGQILRSPVPHRGGSGPVQVSPLVMPMIRAPHLESLHLDPAVIMIGDLDNRHRFLSAVEGYPLLRNLSLISSLAWGTMIRICLQTHITGYRTVPSRLTCLTLRGVTLDWSGPVEQDLPFTCLERLTLVGPVDGLSRLLSNCPNLRYLSCHCHELRDISIALWDQDTRLKEIRIQCRFDYVNPIFLGSQLAYPLPPTLERVVLEGPFVDYLFLLRIPCLRVLDLTKVTTINPTVGIGHIPPGVTVLVPSTFLKSDPLPVHAETKTRNFYMNVCQHCSQAYAEQTVHVGHTMIETVCMRCFDTFSDMECGHMYNPQRAKRCVRCEHRMCLDCARVVRCGTGYTDMCRKCILDLNTC